MSIDKDINNHAFTKYHLKLYGKIKRIHENNEKPKKTQKIFEENGEILWAISKGLEFFGKQGIIGLTLIKLFRRWDKATFSESI